MITSKYACLLIITSKYDIITSKYDIITSNYAIISFSDSLEKYDIFFIQYSLVNMLLLFSVIH